MLFYNVEVAFVNVSSVSDTAEIAFLTLISFIRNDTSASEKFSPIDV